MQVEKLEINAPDGGYGWVVLGEYNGTLLCKLIPWMEILHSFFCCSNTAKGKNWYLYTKRSLFIN